MEEIKEGYTRVSEIIGQWRHLDHIDPGVLANKCRIGTSVHEKICAEVSGIYIDEEEAARGYVQSWQKWHKENEEYLYFVETERRFYCDELMITGAIDAIVEMGDYTFIIDYKTSSVPNKKIWALQGSFYNYLAKQNGFYVDPTVIFLHLKKDGSMAKEVEVYCSPELWEDALRAYELHHYFNC